MLLLCLNQGSLLKFNSQKSDFNSVFFNLNLIRVKISSSEDDSDSYDDHETSSLDEEIEQGFLIPLEEHPNFDENAKN